MRLGVDKQLLTFRKEIFVYYENWLNFLFFFMKQGFLANFGKLIFCESLERFLWNMFGMEYIFVIFIKNLYFSNY